MKKLVLAVGVLLFAVAIGAGIAEACTNKLCYWGICQAYPQEAAWTAFDEPTGNDQIGYGPCPQICHLHRICGTSTLSVKDTLGPTTCIVSPDDIIDIAFAGPNGVLLVKQVKECDAKQYDLALLSLSRESKNVSELRGKMAAKFSALTLTVSSPKQWNAMAKHINRAYAVAAKS